MKIGDLVKINKCQQCQGIVDKIVPVSKLNVEDGQIVSVVLNFGRGRPRTNRPKAISVYDVSLVKE